MCPFSNVSQILPQDAPYYQHLFEQAHPLTKIAANFDEKMEEHAMEEEATVESEDKASYFNVEVKPGGNISEEDEEESHQEERQDPAHGDRVAQEVLTEDGAADL